MSGSQVSSSPEQPTERFGVRWLRALIQLALMLLIIAASGWGGWYLYQLREPAETRTSDRILPLVNIEPVKQQAVPVTVTGQGEVNPRIQAQVVPQVSGRIVYIHPNLVPGGRIPPGKPIIGIDDTDYNAQVEAAQAQVAVAVAGVQMAEASLAAQRSGQLTADAALQQARSALVLIQAQAQAAIGEWQLDHDGEPVPDLVARKPQLAQAQAQVDSARAQIAAARAAVDSAIARLAQAKATLSAAKANLSTAELNLKRTMVFLPFEAMVISEQVDLGQVVGPSPIAVVVDPTLMQVIVPLEDDELAYFKVPDGRGAGGAEAEIWTEYAGQRRSWQGYVARMEGQIDPMTRMVQVVIETQNHPDASVMDMLMPGMFVNVQIHGKALLDVVAIPRSALHEGNTVWIARQRQATATQGATTLPATAQAGEWELQIVPVTPARVERQTVYLSKGLADGDWLITSPMDAVVDGMPIRVHRRDAPTTRAKGAGQ